MLSLQNVRFAYPGSETVYDFSLQVTAGEISCISGRSGSGKSTLLDLIAGFQPPVSGAIHWHQKDFTHLPPDKRPVTTVFQRNNLFEHRNAIDNVVVGINPKVPKQGHDVERAKAALTTVGLQDYFDTQVTLLSGGQQQRVAIARAVLRDAGVILLDEPFSALDQTTRAEMLSLIRTLTTKSARAVIMVTHDLRDCEAIADSHYVIEQGTLHGQSIN